MVYSKQHTGSCTQCVRSLAVFGKLRALASTAEGRQQHMSVQDQDDLVDARHQISICERHLRHFRAHLAQIFAESEHDSEELNGIKDDEALVVADYKMKVCRPSQCLSHIASSLFDCFS